MFFNIEFYQRHMTPEDLLRVEPEVLAKLILHKRERIAQKLPELISNTGNEKQTAENFARQARSMKEDIEPKVDNLFAERSAIVEEWSNISDYTNLNANEKMRLNELIDSIESKQIELDKYNSACEEIVELIAKSGHDVSSLTTIDTSRKANEALKEIINEYETANKNWNEYETKRRRLESKYTKLLSNLKEANLARDYWQERLDSGFEDLLIDANRVANGGLSSRQISRSKREINKSRRV